MQNNNDILELKKEYCYQGASHDGKGGFIFFCKDEEVAQFWLSFLNESPELSNFPTSIINTFIALAIADKPTLLLETSGRAFLLESTSLHDWLFYWKHLDLPFSCYVKRNVIYLAIAVIRYCISKRPSFCALAPLLVDIIKSKEFATFILQEWDGYGFVGVTRTTGTKEPRTLIREFHFRNPALGKLYCEYYQSGFATVRAVEFKRYGDQFEDSLGDMAQTIKSYAQFSEATLFQQVNYFRKMYLMDPKLGRQALRHIVGFYRYVVDTEEGCHIFDKGNFSPNLLKSMTVIQYLADGWDAISFRSIGDYEIRAKLIVVFKDVRGLGTRFVDGDAVAVDLSEIDSDFYRNLLWRYFRVKKGIILNPSNISQLANALHIVEVLKRKKENDFRIIRNTDTQQILANTIERDITDRTIIGIMSLVRNFFEWAISRNYLEAESDITLNILHYRADGVFTARTELAVPREHVIRILGRLAMEAQQSHRGLLVYTIVTMLATTPFRPSQICAIVTQNIRMYQEKGVCVIDGVTKTSSGDKSKCIISPDTYQLLQDVVKKTAEIRETCFSPYFQNLLFVYKGSNGWRRMTALDIKEDIGRACDALDLPRYTTKSFRKMFATVLDEYDRLQGYHGDLAAQLMNHKDKKTTREHYIDRSFKEFQRVENAASISTDEMMEMEYETICKGEKI